MITVYDELGRPVRISAREWQHEVLPDMIRHAWNDPDYLYNVVLMAVQDGFSGSVMTAAERLLEIDPIAERCATIFSIVCMQNGDLIGAERTLQRFLREHEETGIVYTNLAKIQAERGEDIEAERLLRHALQLEPNQDNGLEWWGALHYESGGEDAWLAAMEEIATLPGSWRPQLWIARHHLEHDRLDQALELYDYVLRIASDHPDVLTIISGDLGTRGHVARMLELVEPLYDPAVHDIYAGINLMRGFLDCNRPSEARSLLITLQRHAPPHLMDELGSLETEIIEMLPPQEPVGPIEFSILPVLGPIWARGTSQQSRILPPKTPASRRIVVLSLADTSRANDNGETQIEMASDVDRFTRALPLFLGESLRFRTDAATCTLIPIAKGVGPILSAGPWDVDWLIERIDPETRPEYAISGWLAGSENDQSIEIDIVDLEDGERLRHLSFPAITGLNDLLLHIDDEITDNLEQIGVVRRRRGQTLFHRPPAGVADLYASALEQFLTQHLVAEGHVDPSRLWNERWMMSTYFELVDAMPQSLAPRYLAGRGLLAAFDYGSPVVHTFTAPVLRLLEEDEPGFLAPLAAAIRRRMA